MKIFFRALKSCTLLVLIGFCMSAKASGPDTIIIYKNIVSESSFKGGPDYRIEIDPKLAKANNLEVCYKASCQLSIPNEAQKNGMVFKFKSDNKNTFDRWEGCHSTENNGPTKNGTCIINYGINHGTYSLSAIYTANNEIRVKLSYASNTGGDTWFTCKDALGNPRSVYLTSKDGSHPDDIIKCGTGNKVKITFKKDTKLSKDQTLVCHHSFEEGIPKKIMNNGEIEFTSPNQLSSNLSLNCDLQEGSGMF